MLKVNNKLSAQMKGKQKRKETTLQFVDLVEDNINKRLGEIWTRKTWSEDQDIHPLSVSIGNSFLDLKHPFYFNHELKGRESQLCSQLM